MPDNNSNGAVALHQVAGWYACRKRIHEIAEAREGFTGMSPVVANPTPLR